MSVDADNVPTQHTYLAYTWPWLDDSGNWSAQVDGIKNQATISDSTGDLADLYEGVRKFIVQEEHLAPDFSFAVTLIMAKPPSMTT